MIILRIVFLVISFAATSLLFAQPSITILLPGGHDRWSIGSTYPIRWAVTGVDSIRIDYSTTGINGTWNVITPGVPSSSEGLPGHTNDTFARTGSLYWNVPYAPSDSCYIRIAHKSNPALFDIQRFVITRLWTWSAQVSDVELPLFTVQTVNEVAAWAGGMNGLVMKTVDAGVYWLAAGMIGGDVHTISAIYSSLVVAGSVMTYGRARIYRTTDGGGVWSVVDTTRTVWRYIRMFSGRSGYALGDPDGGFWVLKRTTNGGSSWFDVQPPLPAARGEEGRYNTMLWRDSLRGWFGTNANKVYRTTDGGATWTANEPGISNVTAVYFHSNLYGLVGGADGSISRTTDGGITWNTGSSNLSSAVLGLSGVSSTLQCWAVCSTNVYWSQDSGKTWSIPSEDGYVGTMQLNHISLGGVYGFAYGWAVGNEGTILKYRKIITDVRNNNSKIPNSFELRQNYPNPFNPTTAITYKIPNTNHVTLKVFDLLGRKVATLVDEVQGAGLKSVTLDGSLLPSGVLFYRLSAGNAVFIRKALLLK